MKKSERNIIFQKYGYKINTEIGITVQYSSFFTNITTETPVDLFVFFGTVLGKGAWTEIRAMKKAKAEPEKPAEESKTEEPKEEEEN